MSAVALLMGDLAALRLAVAMHENQTHGDRPFVAHLLDVAWEVGYYKLEEQFPSLLCAAFLHDVVEDTPATMVAIEDMFGCDVATYVWGVTDSTEGKNRAERKANTYAKTRENAGSVALKLCDRKANVKQCHRDGNKGFLRMYQKEHPAFKEALYREGEFERLWADLDELINTEPEDLSPKRVHAPDPLVFRKLSPEDNHLLRPTGHVHLVYEVDHTDDPTEFVDRLTAIRHACCGVELGEGCGPTRLRHMASPSAVDDGHIVGTEVTCPDCLGLLDATET